LVDGICEDLITEFSMMREFDILSRQTSVNFKVENQDIKEFSKQFDVVGFDISQERIDGLAKNHDETLMISKTQLSEFNGKFSSNVQNSRYYH